MSLKPQVCSFEEFDYKSEPIQVILMSHILEHALDVNIWIEKARELLVSDGILVIALSNFNNMFRYILQECDPYICPPAHLNYFSYKSLSRLLSMHGFEILAVQWVSRFPQKTFRNRLPGVARLILPVVRGVSFLALKFLDVLHLSIMINVYARKKGRCE